MNPLKAIKKLGVGIIHSSKRFPVTLLSSISMAILLIIISELGSDISPDTRESLGKITMIFALGIPLSLCARVYYERRNFNNLSKLNLYYFIVSLIQILYYFYFLLFQDLNQITITRFIGINIVFYLIFLFIPYAINRKNFEMYVIHLFTSFLITVIYSFVLFIGLSAILFTVNHLLGVVIPSKTYYYTFLMVTLVFAPGYFLSYVPKEKDDISAQSYSKVLKILILYIVMPLLSIYTFILYLYFGRIILSRTWPEGLVSHLVLWYSLILTLGIFFINPIKSENNWSSLFSTWAPRIVLPLLIMMFISMGIRINAYGVTENRYFVVTLGLWVLGTMVYLSISKNKKFIFLPIGLSIIVLLSVIGPISSYSISQYSQNNRLENILLKNNMLVEGDIRPASDSISKEDKQSISSILSHFNNNRTLDHIELLPNDFEMNDMEKVFGFSYETPGINNNNYFYYSIEHNAKALDISEYDYFLQVSGLYEQAALEQDGFSIAFTSDDNIILIKHEEQIVLEKDIIEFAQYLNENFNHEEANPMPVDDMTFVEENQHYQFQFIFDNLDGQKNGDKNITINYASFDLFIKIK